jgi:prephenate dehydrogenase
MSVARVGVAGLGLIGGSIARRLAEFPDLYEPIGFDVQKQPRSGLELADSIEQLAQIADLLIVATPPRVTGETVAAALAADDDVLVTDVCSVKGPVVTEVGPHPRFLPSHPLAGSETTGWSAARAELLQGATWAVSPPAPDAPPELLCRWAAVFDAFDARVIICDAEEHDRAVARTSHVPHVVAATMAAALMHDGPWPLGAALSGGSFREVARVAASDPALWGEIIELNREKVDEVLASVHDRLPNPPDWQAAGEVARRVRELRWQPPTWEHREFAWPAWDELLELGRAGIAIRRPAVDGNRLSADVAVHS